MDTVLEEEMVLMAAALAAKSLSAFLVQTELSFVRRPCSQTLIVAVKMAQLRAAVT